MKVLKPSEMEGTPQYAASFGRTQRRRYGNELRNAHIAARRGDEGDSKSYNSDEIIFIASGELKVAGQDGEGIHAKPVRLYICQRASASLKQPRINAEPCCFGATGTDKETGIK
jgi:hypothetical protein